MNDAFTPPVRALLDRLEPPPLSAGFADRLVARAEATAVLPPLPPLRKPGLRRRLGFAVAAVGLIGMAAAAAVVPADTWRGIPVIGQIVELIDPAPTDPARAPVRNGVAPPAPEIFEPTVTEAVSQADPPDRPATEREDELLPVEAGAEPPPPREQVAPSVALPEPVERTRDTLDRPAGEIPVAERPTEPREAAAAVVDRPVERTPERLRPADTAETRQQVRERATETRQTTRERTTATRDRTERRTSR